MEIFREEDGGRGGDDHNHSVESYVGGSAAAAAGVSTQYSAAMCRQRSVEFCTGQRKHSSGDLQSRLKTRKVLGVGEIDDGDVHRSKISQILGHSEHLYRKLPKGLWIWQLVEAIMFTGSALLTFVFPGKLYDIMFSVQLDNEASLAMRFYSAALFSLGIMWWNIMGNNDRGVIRMCLLTSVTYYVIQILGTILSLGSLSTPYWRVILSLVVRIIFAAISVCFYRALDHPGYRPSHKASCDIQRTPTKDESGASNMFASAFSAATSSITNSVKNTVTSVTDAAATVSDEAAGTKKTN